MPKRRSRPNSPVVLLCLLVAAVAAPAAAQTSPPATPKDTTASAAGTDSLEALAWLRGCWLGNVNRREFLEQWSPPRGGMMVGFSHTVVGPKFQGTLKEKMESAGE